MASGGYPNPYGQPPPGGIPPYGQQPGDPYGAPPGGMPYGVPPYGAPPYGAQPYGMPPGGMPYGAPPPEASGKYKPFSQKPPTLPYEPKTPTGKQTIEQLRAAYDQIFAEEQKHEEKKSNMDKPYVPPQECPENLDDQVFKKCQTALKDVSTQLSEKSGSKIKVLIDWNFTTHREFDDKKNADKSQCVETLTSDHINRFITYSNGLIDFIDKDSTLVAGNAIKQRVKYVVITYDPENKVKSTIGSYPHYKVELLYYVLRITINLKDSQSSCYSPNVHFEDIFSLHISQAVAESKTKLKELEESFTEKTKHTIAIVIDYYSFVYSKEFLTSKGEDRTRIISTIWTDHLQRALFYSNGLTDLCEKDPITTLKAVKERVKSFVFAYDPTSKIDDKTGSYNYYKFEIDNEGRITMTVNLSSARNSCYSPHEKYDGIFDLRTDQAIVACNEKIVEMEKDLKTKIGKKIPIYVDYRNFVLNKKWKTLKQLSDKTSMIEKISNEHLQRLLFYSNGLADLAENDKIWKEQVNNKVSYIFFTYDPGNTIKSKVGSYIIMI
jgi:hypothetical protein